MKPRVIALSFIALVLLGSSWIAPATAAGNATGGASSFVQNLGATAIELLGNEGFSLEERENQFRTLLTENFDLALIGRFVLGRYWRIATDEQKTDYQRVFGEYVVRTYFAMLGGYSGETFTVLSEQDAGKKDTVVRTRIARPDGAAVLAEWRLRQRDGSFRIVDVSLEGISMAVTQRGEFQSVMQRHGVDGLIQVLEARSAKAEATNAQE